MLKADYLSVVKKSARRDAPNVILILVDCLRARNIGAYGMGAVETPNIDQLAAASFLFRKAFVQMPYTQPSTASIVSSLYPSIHGIVRPDTRFAAETVGAGEIFAAAGYDSAAFVGNPHINPRSGHLAGIQYFSDGRSGLSRLSSRLARWGEDSPALNRAFFRWLARRPVAPRPFFSFLFYIDTHNPYSGLPKPLHRFLNRRLHYPDYARNRYAAAEIAQIERLYRRRVRLADRSIGALVRFLKERGQWERTLLVLSADHGEGIDSRPEHGFHGALYEKGIHVPLIVSAPWLGGAPQAYDTLMESIDILPSLTELTGLPLSEGFQGRSFAPLLKGEPYAPREFVAGEYNDNRYVRTPHWKYINNTEGMLGRSARWSEGADLMDFEEVYDLTADPDEERNVVRALNAPELQLLRAFHAQFLRMLKGPAFSPETYTVDDAVLERLKELGYLE